MKKTLSLNAGIACILTCAATFAAGRSKSLDEEFAHLPLPELPSRAAEIVKQTPAAERIEVAILAVQTVSRQHPAAAQSVAVAVAKAAPEATEALNGIVPGKVSTTASVDKPAPAAGGTLHALGGNGNGNGNGHGNGNGDDHGNAGGNGGVGHGPGPNKPGKIVDHDGPIATTLPNGKPRHFPPDPPRRPVTPPRPVHYNKPGND